MEVPSGLLPQGGGYTCEQSLEKQSMMRCGLSEMEKKVALFCF